MGDLVLMTRPNHIARRDPPQGGAAEILFFTGVRYTRITEADIVALASVTPPRRATKPRRRATKATDAKRA